MPMEITLIGHSCFKIKGKSLSIVIDPYNPDTVGYKMPKVSADVVLLTHDRDDQKSLEAVTDYKFVINSAGEYEISDTFVYGMKTFHDDAKGAERGENIIYQILMDDFSILHLGDLGHELTRETLEKITNVDILMIPVGGSYTIDARTALKVISQVEPSIIIPMHFQTEDLKLPQKLQDVKAFLEEYGAEGNGLKEADKLRFLTRNDIPEESEVYLLSPQH